MKRLLLLALALLYGALALSAQTRYIRDERHAGLAVTVGSTSLVYYGAHQLPVPGSQATTVAPPAADASMEVSWKWAPPDGSAPRTIRVALEKRPGQSIPSWARDFREAVDAMLDLYPPNVGTSAGIVTGGGAPGRPSWPSGGSIAIETGVTLEVSWKHDPDKGADGSDGPLQPVTVRAAVEKRDGESSREAARRLSNVVEALQDAFPPNVPDASGG